ncbi:MAG: NCS2 family permease [Exilibacterium sp.]
MSKSDNSGLVEKVFQLKARNSRVKTEVIAGATTFLTMVYIIFVNPNILSSAGMDHGAVFIATCIAAAVGCMVMGVYANYPIALAPGMGLNAFFSFTVVGELGYSWQVALGAVFLSGLVFLALSIFQVREWIINSIPHSLRLSMGAGIGLFLGIIALKTAGIVVASPATLVTLGDLKSAEALLAILSFLTIAVLSYKRIPGAVMIGILVSTAIGLALGEAQFNGVVSAPPSLLPTLGQLDIAGAFEVGMISIIFAFLFVDLFDTAGTLLGVMHRGNLLDEAGRLPAVVCGILFFLCIFFSPLAATVPGYATAGALLYVAVLMTEGLAQINWKDVTESAPAVIAAIMMPLSFSIANGIALGFIAYTLIKVASGRREDVTLSVYVLCALFVAKFAFL